MTIKTIRIFEFPGCVVTSDITNNYTETSFPDGTKVPATPNFDEKSLEQARELGYGDDTAAMTREHEILHTWLAVKLGHSYSPTLWDVAHNQNLGQGLHGEEEKYVLGFQRWMNKDLFDPYLLRELLHLDVNILRDEAIRDLRDVETFKEMVDWRKFRAEGTA